MAVVAVVGLDDVFVILVVVVAGARFVVVAFVVAIVFSFVVAVVAVG